MPARRWCWGHGAVALWGLLLLLVAAVGSAVAGTVDFGRWMTESGVEPVWQIGTLDGNAAEFALFPSEANRFAARFPNGVVYTIGTSHTADMPFIHPSELDRGWGGAAEVPFMIRFNLGETAASGLQLVIGLVDTQELYPSTMKVFVNGAEAWRSVMPKGLGRAYYGERRGKSCLLTVPISTDRLHPGANEISISLTGGSWVAYDAIALVKAPSGGWIAPAHGSTSGLPAVDMAGLRADGVLRIPEEGGAQVFASPGGALTMDLSGESRSFDMECDVRVTRGTLSISCETPTGGRGAIWQLTSDGKTVSAAQTPLCRTSPKELTGTAGWTHLRIRHRAEKTFVTMGGGSAGGSQTVLAHAPAPVGCIKLVGGQDGAVFSVANLRVRETPERSTAIVQSGDKRTAVAPGIAVTRLGDRLTVRNGRAELSIGGPSEPVRLRDLATGRVYADMPYIWEGCPGLRRVGAPVVASDGKGGKTVSLTLRGGGLEVVQTWSASKSVPDALTESIRVRNTVGDRLDTSKFGCGLARRVFDGKSWFASLGDSQFSPLPYIRATETGELGRRSIDEMVWRAGWYYPNIGEERKYTTESGAEGWAWEQGNSALLVLKHNPRSMEWSLTKPTWLGDGSMALRFGGAGMWKLGDPESAASLAPGESVQFGETLYRFVDGGWKGAAYAFRGFMDAHGHATPAGFNPPVHWNELYDNPLWWGPDTMERRNEMYRKDDILKEAAKAKEFGCEALYLDPGWDTPVASTIWGAERMGPETEFVSLLKRDYGLSLSLHAPLAAWSSTSAYPEECRLMGRDGKRIDAICSASPAYVKTKSQRLLDLCRDGATYLMFDGSTWTGECWDRSHGHSIPLRRQDQCDAYRKLSQIVHAKYPNVIIEQHDPIVGGIPIRYALTYSIHGKKGDFDDLWGYEYMWDPMADITSGRALSLYYMNLAYSIPVYIHIDLRKDNIHAQEFWWFASTCRHLGVGGKHQNPAVWEAQKAAMKQYLALKRYYTQGRFYGLDESVHAHTLPDGSSCVMNLFNLSDVESEKDLRFSLNEIGMRPGELLVDGRPVDAANGSISMRMKIPARGHRLVVITKAR